MKITSLVSPPSVDRPARAKRSQGKDLPETPVNIQVSGDARWLADIKEAAADLPEQQASEVERANRDIADGHLEDRVDWDVVIDALIMEL